MLGQIAAATLTTVVPESLLANKETYHVHNMATDHAIRIASGRKITLRILMPQGSGDNLKPVIDAFQQATGISITMVQTPVDDINTQLTLDSLSEEGDYDIALPATFGLPDLVESNAIIPLTPYAEIYEPAGFRDNILYNIGDSFDGDLYGFQTDGDAYLMFYHRDLLENPEEQARYADEFGESLAVPLTWQQLDQQMAFFNRPESNLFGGLLFRNPGYLAWEWWVRFHAKGYWPLSETLEPQIASDAGVEALEEMIRATEHLSPGVGNLGLFENWERYSRGDIYCNIGWGGSQKFLNSNKSKMQGRMLYGPTPGGYVDGELLVTPYFNWGWNYVVTTGSHEPELAYLFALFASSSKQSTSAVRQAGGYFDPIRLEHYNDPEIQRIYSREFLAVHEKSLKSAIPDLYLANQGQYFRTLNQWLDRALSGTVNPETALKRAAQQWRLITERSDTTLQQSRWINLRDKYPSEVSSRLRDIV
ncbi:MAG: extracellular solute-binding protein [Granulosicoccus sp.]